MKMSTKLLGRGLEMLFMLLIGIVIISAFVNSFFPDLLMGEKVMKAMEDAYGFNIKKLSMLTRGLLIFVGSISTAIIVYGLWIGTKIARLVGKGEVISEQSAELFVQLKKIILYWGVFNVVQCFGSYQFLMPKMEFKMMVWSLAMMSIGQLLFFIFFASIAAVVVRGARLKKEQDLTV